MTANYDPRTYTGIPTEPVGSLPRPIKLQEAYAAYDAGKISFAIVASRRRIIFSGVAARSNRRWVAG